MAHRGGMRRFLALAALFSGAALLAHLLAGLSLRLCLAATTTAALTLSCALWFRADARARRRVARRVAVGLKAGVAALVAYDAAKYLLSLLDPSPYNPFEALRMFGVLLAGPQAPAPVVWASGAAFHATNGVAFGVAFALWSGRGGVLPGIGWGLFLELFQLALFPGWLQIRAWSEFARISALSHVVYGAVLGSLVRKGGVEP